MHDVKRLVYGFVTSGLDNWNTAWIRYDHKQAHKQQTESLLEPEDSIWTHHPATFYIKMPLLKYTFKGVKWFKHNAELPNKIKL